MAACSVASCRSATSNSACRQAAVTPSRRLGGVSCASTRASCRSPSSASSCSPGPSGAAPRPSSRTNGRPFGGSKPVRRTTSRRALRLAAFRPVPCPANSLALVAAPDHGKAGSLLAQPHRGDGHSGSKSTPTTGFVKAKVAANHPFHIGRLYRQPRARDADPKGSVRRCRRLAGRSPVAASAMRPIQQSLAAIAVTPTLRSHSAAAQTARPPRPPNPQTAAGPGERRQYGSPPATIGQRAVPALPRSVVPDPPAKTRVSPHRHRPAP